MHNETRWVMISTMILLFLLGIPAPERLQRPSRSTHASIPYTEEVASPFPLAYPLRCRLPFENFCDHTNIGTRDEDITIYTGETNLCDDNPENDTYCDPPGVCGCTDNEPHVRSLRWRINERNGYPGWLWYDGHTGYDLPCNGGDSVNASNAGILEHVDTPEGIQGIRIVGSSGEFRTVYWHLQQRRSQGAVGIGEHIAEVETGANSHLHFSVQRLVNGNWKFVDPMGWEGTDPDPWPHNVGNLWVGEDPIPMGYVDQDGGAHGPFALSNSTIRDLWLGPGVARRLGSPLGEVSNGLQHFERGLITAQGKVTYYDEISSTFLPSIYASEDVGGRNSTIHVRNLTGESTSVNITFYAPEGWVLDSRTYTNLAGRATWDLDVHEILAPFDDPNYTAVFTGSAVVVANRQVAAVVRTETQYAQSPNTVTAYTGVSTDNGNSGWGEPGTQIHVPTIFWNPDWADYQWRSTLHIQNAGDGPTDVTVHYYSRDGSPAGSETVILDVNGSVHRPTSYPGNLYDGSAYLESSAQPVAVVVTQEDLNEGTRRASQYNAFSGGAETINLPSVMRAWYNWTSSFTVQNLTDSTIETIVVEYRGRDGSSKTCVLQDLGPHHSCIVVQDQEEPSDACGRDPLFGTCDVSPDWEGSVVLRSSGGAIAAVVNQKIYDPSEPSMNRHQSYSGFISGANLVYAPFVRYQYWPEEYGPTAEPAYRSTMHVQNVGEEVATVSTVKRYCDANGTVEGASGSTQDLTPGEEAMFPACTENLPEEFAGSAHAALVLGNSAIAGINNYARAVNGAETDDFGASYSMPQRTDGLAPTSQVGALPTYNPARFQVAWSGEDDLAGIASYDIQVCTVDCDSPNRGEWIDWLVQTALTSSLFTGDHGVNYAFRCRARDHVGNVEPYPSEPDTATTVDTQPSDTAVEAMALYTTSASFPVRWDGSDDLSGLDHYDICVRDESTADWQPWIEGTTINQAIFSGNAGHTYHGKKPPMIQTLPSVSHQA